MSWRRQVLVRLARMAQFFPARIADEKAVLSIEDHAFHFALAGVVVMATAPSEQNTFISSHWPRA